MDALRDDDPRLLGKYTLLARLGSGGMGQVYFGRSLGGRQVAVKVIRSDLARDPDFRLRFAREVEAARRVSGAFTAPVIDADPDAPVPWLVTGYVNGPSLADAVDQHGPLPLASVLTLAAGLAEGLSAVHEAGVIHRDLKPGNVLLAQDGPRLIDFGISQAADFAQITSTGIAVGTPGFMSPEQVLGEPVGPSSDIFTLGAVLAFAATGEPPYGSGSSDARNQRVLHLAPRLDNLPGELRPLVERCMARNPADRPTAGQFLADVVAAHPEAADQAEWLPEGILAGATPRRTQTPPPGRGTPPAPEKGAVPEGKTPPPGEDPPPGAETPPGGETAATAAGTGRTLTSVSTPPPVPPPPTPPPVPTDHPADGRPGRTRRRAWVIGAVAAVAVIGTVIGVLAVPSGGGPQKPAVPPPPTPAGLLALQETASSVEITWNPPASGAGPDKYEILQNGKALASVPGYQTNYNVTGLKSDAAYQFSVMAVSGTGRSAPSNTITARTIAPPPPSLADAAFNYSGSASYEETASSDKYWKKVGTTWQDSWTLNSDCGVKPCGTTLTGSIDGVAFTASLSRSGATYTGSAAINNWWTCVSKNNYIHSTLHIKLTGTQAGSPFGSWVITAFTGSVIWDVPYDAKGGCAASKYQMQVHSG